MSGWWRAALAGRLCVDDHHFGSCQRGGRPFSLLPGVVRIKIADLAVAGVIVLTVMNLRAVKELGTVLTPVFLIFILTHLFVVVYTIFTQFRAVLCAPDR